MKQFPPRPWARSFRPAMKLHNDLVRESDFLCQLITKLWRASKDDLFLYETLREVVLKSSPLFGVGLPENIVKRDVEPYWLNSSILTGEQIAELELRGEREIVDKYWSVRQLEEELRRSITST